MADDNLPATPEPAKPGFIDYHGGRVTQPAPTGTHASLQWKGTDACLDFYCECGAQGHFDGYFAYAVKCGGCGQEWEMPTYFYPRKMGPTSYPRDPVELEMWDEDDA